MKRRHLFKQVDCSLKQDGPIDIGISVRQAKFLQRRYQATFQTAAVIRSEVQLLRQLIGFLEADAFNVLDQSVRIFVKDSQRFGSVKNGRYSLPDYWRNHSSPKRSGFSRSLASASGHRASFPFFGRHAADAFQSFRVIKDDVDRFLAKSLDDFFSCPFTDSWETFPR